MAEAEQRQKLRCGTVTDVRVAVWIDSALLLVIDNGRQALGRRRRCETGTMTMTREMGTTMVLEQRRERDWVSRFRFSTFFGPKRFF
ncbi:hypothetical protein SESBI_01399 [Sesbania bispinosa]|nr:hypothetical protein SESBI_01399 [Sesbania bispinosa]